MTITTTLTSKGQVTISKKLRDKLDLKKGDKLVLVEEDKVVFVFLIDPWDDVYDDLMRKLN